MTGMSAGSTGRLQSDVDPGSANRLSSSAIFRGWSRLDHIDVCMRWDCLVLPVGNSEAFKILSLWNGIMEDNCIAVLHLCISSLSLAVWESCCAVFPRGIVSSKAVLRGVLCPGKGTI